MSDAKPRIGLALGGGGVKGIAHIPLLKLLDKHGLQPSQISGTSMGAIIGAMYATGLSGAEIEQRVRDRIGETGESVRAFFRKGRNLIRWVRLFSIERERGGFVAADGLFDKLMSELKGLQFSELAIPFCASAVDFHLGTEVCLREGEVESAVRASMAVPGVFAPIRFGERLLVDGGLVNNLPTNHIQNCDIKIASDVIAPPVVKDPKATEVISGALSIVISHATRCSLEAHPVDVLCQSNMEGIEAYDLRRIPDALERGEEAAAAIEPQLLERI